MVRRAGIVLLLISSLLAPMAPADAAAPRYVTKSRAVPAGASGFLLKVTCPKRTQVIAGGVAVGPGTADTFSITASRPFDNRDRRKTPDDGWLGIVNNKTAGTATVKVTAICSRTKGHSYVSEASTAPDGLVTANDLDCPPGTFVIGGGGAIGGRSPKIERSGSIPFDEILEAGSTPEDGWRVRINNDGGVGLGLPFTTYAICGPVEPVYAVDTSVLASPDGASFNDECPANTAVAGGGADFEDGTTVNTELHQTIPFDGLDDDQIPEDGWRTLFWNFSGAPETVRRVVVCAAL